MALKPTSSLDLFMKACSIERSCMHYTEPTHEVDDGKQSSWSDECKSREQRLDVGARVASPHPNQQAPTSASSLQPLPPSARDHNRCVLSDVSGPSTRGCKY
jgi:hypothetical protein